MTDKLIQLTQKIITILSCPWVWPIAMVVVTLSVILAILTSGTPLIECGNGPAWFFHCRWDPGASYTNTVQNEIQLIILFAQISLTALMVGNNEKLHKRIDSLHDKHDSLERKLNVKKKK